MGGKINPLKKIYELCNSGEPIDKYNKLPEFPRYIDIELTNYCNYNCLMCPVGTGTMKRKKGFMSDETYNKILEEIKKYKTPIRFIRWGEPTLHKNFIEYIKRAKELGIIVHFNTNGSLLNIETMEQIVGYGLDSIKFSFQGIDEKSYAEMRNKQYFNTLLSTIKTLYQIRGESEKPYIHIASTITYETKEQVENFKNRVKRYCDLVTVGRTILEHIDVENVKLNKEDKDRLIKLKSKESVIKKHFNCCPEVFDKLSINWNGDVTACSSDYDNSMIIGNIHNNSLIDIWKCDIANKFRTILSNRNYEKIELCKGCYDYMELQSDE